MRRDELLARLELAAFEAAEERSSATGLRTRLRVERRAKACANAQRAVLDERQPEFVLAYLSGCRAAAERDEQPFWDEIIELAEAA